MSTIKVKPINTEDLEKETAVEIVVNKTTSLTISNQEEYENAAVVLTEVKSRYKELDTLRKSITSPMDAAKKVVMDLFKKPLEKLESAEKKIKSVMIGYTETQERIAREEAARLQKLADQEADRQKKLIEKKIERAEASGKTDKVEELQFEKENIIPITAPVVAPKIDAPAGVSYKILWSAEVVDINLIPREYLIVNQQALNKVAQATKGTIPIPGVKFVSTKTLASRG